MKKITFILLFASTLFSSCKQAPSIEGFDSDKWKADYMCCSNTRLELVKILLANKEKLKSLDDDQVAELLGSPERNRQFARGKKNYIYFIEPGSQCTKVNSTKEGKKLVIEFDALGKPRIIRESYIDY